MDTEFKKEMSLEEFYELYKSIYEKEEIEEEPSEKPKVLTPYSGIERERGIALSKSLSAGINSYLEGLQRARDERYQNMIDEAQEIESPRTRRR